jgi:phytoene synthase
MARAAVQAGLVSLLPRSPVLHARPLDETAFLVAAAADPRPLRAGWGDAVTTAMAALAANDGRGARRGWPSP